MSDACFCVPTIYPCRYFAVSGGLIDFGIYGPFADHDPPQALVLKSDEILGNERRMMWRSGRALQAKPARAIRSRVGTTPADDVVAGIL